MKLEEPLTIEECIHVRNTMEFYNRTSGYIAYVEGRLTFFDAEPNKGGYYVELWQLQATITKDDTV